MAKWHYDGRHLRAVAAVIKKRFNNLTVDETINLTTDILDAVKSAEGEGKDG